MAKGKSKPKRTPLWAPTELDYRIAYARYEGLVQYLARRYFHSVRLQTLTLEDLVGAGRISIGECLPYLDRSLEVRQQDSWMGDCIEGAIKHEFRDKDGVVRTAGWRHDKGERVHTVSGHREEIAVLENQADPTQSEESVVGVLSNRLQMIDAINHADLTPRELGALLKRYLFRSSERRDCDQAQRAIRKLRAYLQRTQN